MSGVEPPFVESVYKELIYHHMRLHGKLVDTAGIEPASPPCQRGILPLNYRPIEIVLVDLVGIEPTTKSL